MRLFIFDSEGVIKFAAALCSPAMSADTRGEVLIAAAALKSFAVDLCRQLLLISR